MTQSVADLLGYTNNITKSDSNSGKFFFANGTTDGKNPVSEAAKGIFAARGGVPDVFGKAYHGRAAARAPTPTAIPGRSRPCRSSTPIAATIISRIPRTASTGCTGEPELTDSPSYPSGHTTFGYTESLVLALPGARALPANDRAGGRVRQQPHRRRRALRHGRARRTHGGAARGRPLLANDPDYVGQIRKNPAVINEMSRQTNDAVAITDYRAALETARNDLAMVLKDACGDTVAACAATDTGRFRDAAANQALYDTTQTYGLPVVHATTANTVEDVGKLAPEAGYLLTAAFPSVTLAEANAILTETQGPGGGFLDDGSAFGVYSRLNLYAAAGKASALAASRRPQQQTTR